jgi:hypothetical protein
VGPPDTILEDDHPMTIAKNRKKGEENLKKIISSETTEPISTKLC